MWEVYANAQIPLTGMKNYQVYMKLLRGEVITHSQPTLCPDAVWQLLEPCFSEDPNLRPTYVLVLCMLL